MQNSVKPVPATDDCLQHGSRWQFSRCELSPAAVKHVGDCSIAKGQGERSKVAGGDGRQGRQYRTAAGIIPVCVGSSFQGELPGEGAPSGQHTASEEALGW